MRGRQEILELYLQDKPVAADVNANAIARGTPGFNGAGSNCFFFFFFLKPDSSPLTLGNIV